MRMRAKGFGTMKRSQLRSRQARETSPRIGTTGTSARSEAIRTPAAGSPAGPRGPSGVIANSRPDLSSRTIERSARPAPRELEPRTVRYPQRCTSRAMISPSECSLIITVMPSPRRRQVSGSRCPCQSVKMKGFPAARSARQGPSFRSS